jgi:ParB-like chromosome segregation protein Spo0J
LSAIEASLREFGQVEPLVVQRASKKIIGGNGRFKVMKHLGWATAKVYWVDFDDMRAAALGIALNRTAELATWDAGALDSLIRQIETDNPGLQAMLAALAEQEGVAGEPAEPTPPDEFAAVDESIETEHKCPRCGYEWSGKSK